MSVKVVIALNTAWNLINFRSNLIRELVKNNFSVIAIAPDDKYSYKLSELGCRFIPFPMDNQGTNPFQDLLLLYRFWRLLRNERPNIYLGYTVKPNIFGSLAAHTLGIPVINNITGLGAAFIKGGWLASLITYLYRLSLSKSSKVFFQNPDDLRVFIHSGIVKANVIDLLPGSGVDLSKFKLEAVKMPLRRRFRILLIARMLWDKGIGEFVESARFIRKMKPEVEFCLLGFLDIQNPAAITRKQIDHWVSEGVVIYLGEATDVRSHIADADCVVLPSYREGTPRVLLEAAAMGRPIVTTDVEGCREVVDDGLNGFLCRPRDAEDLTRKLEKILNLSLSERIAMGLNGRLKMVKEFDEKIVIKKYLDSIKEIL